MNSQQQPQQESPQQESGQATSTRDNVVRSGKLSEFERGLLKKFRDKVDKFKHTLCPTCNESFPSITLVKGECRRCYAEKISPKEVSDELQAEKTFPENSQQRTIWTQMKFLMNKLQRPFPNSWTQVKFLMNFKILMKLRKC